MKGSVGGTTLSGNLSWNTAAERPRLVADLNTGAVAVERYLRRSRSAALRGSVPGMPIQAAWTVPEGADPWAGLMQTIALAEGIDTERWPTDIVDLGALQAFDAVVSLHSKALSYKAYKLDNAAIEATLERGRADLSSVKGMLFGGGFDGSATLDAVGRTLAAKATLKDLDLSRAGKAFGGGAVSAGRFDLDADLTASGKSVAEWVSSLTGKGRMAARGLRAGAGNRTDELAVIAWLPAIFDQLRSAFGVQSGATDGGGSFTMANGRIVCPDLAVVSDVGKATAKGTVDLPRWQLDFEGDVTPEGQYRLVAALRDDGDRTDGAVEGQRIAGRSEDRTRPQAPARQRSAPARQAAEEPAQSVVCVSRALGTRDLPSVMALARASESSVMVYGLPSSRNRVFVSPDFSREPSG